MKVSEAHCVELRQWESYRWDYVKYPVLITEIYIIFFSFLSSCTNVIIHDGLSLCMSISLIVFFASFWPCKLNLLLPSCCYSKAVYKETLAGRRGGFWASCCFKWWKGRSSCFPCPWISVSSAKCFTIFLTTLLPLWN